MKRLFSLILSGALTAIPFGCTSETATPPATPDTSAELGEEGSLDQGTMDTGSTTGTEGPTLPDAGPDAGTQQ